MATKRQKNHINVVKQQKRDKKIAKIVNSLQFSAKVKLANIATRHVRPIRRWQRLMFLYTSTWDKLIYLATDQYPDRLRLKRGGK